MSFFFVILESQSEVEKHTFLFVLLVYKKNSKIKFINSEGKKADDENVTRAKHKYFNASNVTKAFDFIQRNE